MNFNFHFPLVFTKTLQKLRLDLLLVYVHTKSVKVAERFVTCHIDVHKTFQIRTRQVRRSEIGTFISSVNCVNQ